MDNLKAYKDCTSTNVVVTVPAYFTIAQREATCIAGRIAKINVVSCISEPTAAALAYGLHEQIDKSVTKYVIVFDFGGGTLDVSLVSIANDIYNVLATEGDPHLGGEDIDILMAKYCMKSFEELYDIKIPLNSDKGKIAFLKFKMASEKCKKYLSGRKAQSITIPNIYDDKSFEIRFTVKIFEKLIENIVKKCVKILSEVITRTEKVHSVKKKQIKDIVLVGGSSKIPAIRQAIAKFFKLKVKDLRTDINADLAIARGATIYAASLYGKGYDSVDTDNITLHDIAPYSFGVGYGPGDKFCKLLIPKGQRLPWDQVTNGYNPVNNYQPGVNITVYQGESTLTKFNSKIGEFYVKLPPRLSKELNIEFQFIIDFSCKLKAIATITDITTGKKITDGISIQNKNMLSEKEIESIKQDSIEMEKQIKNKKKINEACNNLVDQISEYEFELQDINNELKEEMKKYIKKLKRWIHDTKSTTVEEYNRRLNKLKIKWDTTMKVVDDDTSDNDNKNDDASNDASNDGKDDDIKVDVETIFPNKKNTDFDHHAVEIERDMSKRRRQRNNNDTTNAWDNVKKSKIWKKKGKKNQKY